MLVVWQSIAPIFRFGPKWRQISPGFHPWLVYSRKARSGWAGASHRQLQGVGGGEGAVGRAESVRAPATRVSVKNRIIAPPETMAKDEEPGILPASEDAYGGVIVDKRSLPASPEIFEKSLAMSLEEYLMLNHWLPQSPSTLPANASHQVGVGGFVLNEKREVLVVQEMNGPLRGQGVWKMPTGLVSVGEDLHLAAVREVKEETGVDAQFEAVLATRQSHGMAFGKSDLFFVCALRADSNQTLTPCNTEISDVTWIPLEEFCNIEFMKGRELYAEILKSCEAWANGNYSGFRSAKLESGIWAPRQDLLLFGSDD